MPKADKLKGVSERAKKVAAKEEGRLEELAHNVDVEVRYDASEVRHDMAKGRQHGPHGKGKQFSP